MVPETVLDLGRDALWLAVLLAGPLLGAALAVGLFIGVIQAATQIQEMTLSFIPKLLALVVTLFVIGPWMLRIFTTFAQRFHGYSRVGGLDHVTDTCGTHIGKNGALVSALFACFCNVTDRARV